MPLYRHLASHGISSDDGNRLLEQIIAGKTLRSSIVAASKLSAATSTAVPGPSAAHVNFPGQMQQAGRWVCLLMALPVMKGAALLADVGRCTDRGDIPAAAGLTLIQGCFTAMVTKMQ
jgi:hypothetical protein